MLTNQKVKQGSTTHLDLTYDYGNLYTESGQQAGWKTGQLSKITDNKSTERSRKYTYDKLGRLKEAKGGASFTRWSQTYSYDRYGNRLTVTKSGVDAYNNTMVADGLASVNYFTASNRIDKTNFTYDAAGNQTKSDENGLVNNYKYDAAGRLAEVTNSATHTYAYGASNQRLQSVEGSTTTLYAWAGGSVIAEYNGASNGMAWTKSYVYLGGRLLATETPLSNSTTETKYQHPDRLGTRLVTNTSGAVVSENIGLPFGAIIAGESTNIGGSATKKRFTSYERSDSTALDYAVNRHYSAAQGRFTQVDLVANDLIDLYDPQSLNLYAYCLNDPINYLDPDGLFAQAFVAAGVTTPMGAIIVLVAIAVISALRLLFGGRGAQAKMGARIERRFAPVETGSGWSWAEPSIRAGVGAVRAFTQNRGVKKPKQKKPCGIRILEAARAIKDATPHKYDKDRSITSGGVIYPANYHCNIFVRDALAKAGIKPPTLPNKHAITAGMWGNPTRKVPGFEIVMDSSQKPGDIAASNGGSEASNEAHT